MSRKELYGIPAKDIDLVADELARELALPFQKRESGFWGEYCLLNSGDDFEFKVYYNEDPLHDPHSDAPQDRYFEPEYPGLRILLYACLSEGGLDRLGQVLIAAFPGTVLIRSEGNS